MMEDTLKNVNERNHNYLSYGYSVLTFIFKVAYNYVLSNDKSTTDYVLDTAKVSAVVAVCKLLDVRTGVACLDNLTIATIATGSKAGFQLVTGESEVALSETIVDFVLAFSSAYVLDFLGEIL